MSQDKQKILHLESLRGIASLLVLFFHHWAFIEYYGPRPLQTALIKEGWVMVDFFFVLSGFVIALNYMERVSTKKQLITFQIKRFFRLYPLHLLTLGLMLLGRIISQRGKGPFAESGNTDLTSFIENLFLSQGFLSGNFISWNIPAWSISAEFYTYFLFALLTFFSGKKLAPYLYAVASIVGFFLLMEYDSMNPKLVSHFRCWYAFFIGCLSYKASQRFDLKIPSLLSYFFFALPIVLIYLSPGENRAGLNLLIPPIFALALLCSLKTRADNLFLRLLENKALVYLGTLSYGLYLFHHVVKIILLKASKGIIYNPTADGSPRVATDLIERLQGQGFLAISLCISLLLAHLSYQYFEKPIARWVRRRWPSS